MELRQAGSFFQINLIVVQVLLNYSVVLVFIQNLLFAKNGTEVAKGKLE